MVLEQELKLGAHEPDTLFVGTMQTASEVVAAKMALFSSLGKSVAALVSQSPALNGISDPMHGRSSS